ncbi:MAG: ABC transporter ATP-binding protein [Desulforhopalus sp.]
MNGAYLSIRNVTFLGKGPFTFSLAKGECLGLSGRSGIGKTQLFRAITDLIPYQGEISLDGKSSDSYPAPVWRSLVAMVVADSSWWYDRVGDHFTSFTDNPFIDTCFPRLGFAREVMEWRVSRLSTGERQRLALLRALQNCPGVLLLDEPTSALDGYHTEQVERCIADLRIKRGVSVVWVSHDPEQLQRVAVREMCMEERCLVEIVRDRVADERKK